MELKQTATQTAQDMISEANAMADANYGWADYYQIGVCRIEISSRRTLDGLVRQTQFSLYCPKTVAFVNCSEAEFLAAITQAETPREMAERLIVEARANARKMGLYGYEGYATEGDFTVGASTMEYRDGTHAPWKYSYHVKSLIGSYPKVSRNAFLAAIEKGR